MSGALPDPAPVRLDKWLWAARFYKTRSLASTAIEGGKVKLNGERAKPAKTIRPGDRLHIQIGEFTWDIEVMALAEKRGPASLARTLYAETEASQARRAAQIADRPRLADPAAGLHGRPEKRDRRLIHRFTRAGD